MTQQATNTQRLYWVDLIRVVAIFLVIVIHVSANLLYDWGKIPLSNWMAGNIYDSVSRISVPLLFMISGSLLLAKNEPMKDFFQKRALKLLIPFIGWSLIYLFWRCNINEGVCSKKIVLRLILFEGTSYHLWFLYALIGIYLITPLLRLIVASNQKAVLWYFVALWLFFESGTAILVKAWGVPFGISVPMATGYIGFFILGYLLGETHLSGRNILLIFILWLASTTATAAGTYFMSVQAGEFDGFFYEYLSINVILSSVSAFILLKSLSRQKFLTHPVIFNLLNRIAAGSFGIYLIHVLVLDIIGGRIPLIHFNAEMGHPVWSIPLVSGVAFIASFCAVYILQKIPIINRLVP